MSNFKPRLSEKQIRQDERNKTLAWTYLKLRDSTQPVFPQNFFSEVIVGFKNRQNFHEILKRYYPTLKIEQEEVK